MSQETHRQFETSGDEWLPFTFSGFNIACHTQAPLLIDQTFYLRKLGAIDTSSSFSYFRTIRMKVAWLANTRPDLQFEISQLVQITAARFKEDAAAHVKRLNSDILYARNKVAHLLFPKLGISNLRIVGYLDAAFANRSKAINRDASHGPLFLPKLLRLLVCSTIHLPFAAKLNTHYNVLFLCYF